MKPFSKVILCILMTGALDAVALRGDEANERRLEARIAALEAKMEALLAENDRLRGAAQAPVATVAPAPAPQEKPKPAAAVVTIAGKETKLALGGYAQVQAEVGDAPDSRFASANDRVRLRRVRLNLKGTFTDDLVFQAQAELAGSPSLTDLYLQWTANPSAVVKFGQFKTPFGDEQLESDTSVPFIERSQGSDQLTMGRQIGVNLSGDIAGEHLGYSAGIFNGNGVNQSNNDNDRFMWAARLTSTVFDGEVAGAKSKWVLGGNAFANNITSSGFSGDKDGVGFDTRFNWGAANLLAEWLSVDSDPLVGASSTGSSWQVAGVYDFDKHWQGVARYETYDSGPGSDTKIVTFGANYFPFDGSLKLSVNYMLGGADFGGNDDRLILRAQIIY